MNVLYSNKKTVIEVIMNTIEIIKSFNQSYQKSKYVVEKINTYAYNRINTQAAEILNINENKTARKVNNLNNVIKNKLDKEDLIEVYKVFASTSMGSLAGKRLQEQIYLLCKKYFQKVYKQYKYNGLHQNSDVLIQLDNGKKIILYIQRALWDGGQQANRCDKYIPIITKIREIGDQLFLIVADPIPTHWKQNGNDKTSKLVLTQIGRNNILYYSDLQEILKQLRIQRD